MPKGTRPPPRTSIINARAESKAHQPNSTFTERIRPKNPASRNIQTERERTADAAALELFGVRRKRRGGCEHNRQQDAHRSLHLYARVWPSGALVAPRW